MVEQSQWFEIIVYSSELGILRTIYFREVFFQPAAKNKPLLSRCGCFWAYHFGGDSCSRGREDLCIIQTEIINIYITTLKGARALSSETDQWYLFSHFSILYLLFNLHLILYTFSIIIERNVTESLLWPNLGYMVIYSLCPRSSRWLHLWELLRLKVYLIDIPFLIIIQIQFDLFIIFPSISRNKSNYKPDNALMGFFSPLIICFWWTYMVQDMT